MVAVLDYGAYVNFKIVVSYRACNDAASTTAKEAAKFQL